MSLLQVNFFADTLKRVVPMQVILPVDGVTADGGPALTKGCAVPPFKTLYLLHGYLGNYTDWVSRTNILRYAEERQIAVVMPSGDNSFYIDHPVPGHDYGRFIGEELVSLTRQMFPLSHRREDTFIAGLSMGGYGAIRNGLKYHETFSHVASLSGAVHIFEIPEGGPGRKLHMEDRFFGNMEKAAQGENNPRRLIEWLLEKKGRAEAVHMPRLYMACGQDDVLLEGSRIFRDLLNASGFDLTYEEGPGAHEWDFWDRYIQKVLDWLPLT